MVNSSICVCRCRLGIFMLRNENATGSQNAYRKLGVLVHCYGRSRRRNGELHWSFATASNYLWRIERATGFCRQICARKSNSSYKMFHHPEPYPMRRLQTGQR